MFVDFRFSSKLHLSIKSSIDFYHLFILSPQLPFSYIYFLIFSFIRCQKFQSCSGSREKQEYHGYFLQFLLFLLKNFHDRSSHIIIKIHVDWATLYSVPPIADIYIGSYSLSCISLYIPCIHLLISIPAGPDV